MQLQTLNVAYNTSMMDHRKRQQYDGLERACSSIGIWDNRFLLFLQNNSRFISFERKFYGQDHRKRMIKLLIYKIVFEIRSQLFLIIWFNISVGQGRHKLYIQTRTAYIIFKDFHLSYLLVILKKICIICPHLFIQFGIIILILIIIK